LRVWTVESRKSIDALSLELNDHMRDIDTKKATAITILERSSLHGQRETEPNQGNVSHVCLDMTSCSQLFLLWIPPLPPPLPHLLPLSGLFRSSGFPIFHLSLSQSVSPRLMLLTLHNCIFCKSIFKMSRFAMTTQTMSHDNRIQYKSSIRSLVVVQVVIKILGRMLRNEAYGCYADQARPRQLTC
jgi:hypothetical protein